MRLVAFITHSAGIRQILNYIGVESESPHITPHAGYRCRSGCDSQVDECADGKPDWDQASQPIPDYAVDQRVNW